MKLIKLTGTTTGNILHVNIDHIIYFETGKVDGVVRLVLIKDWGLFVQEIADAREL